LWQRAVTGRAPPIGPCGGQRVGWVGGALARASFPCTKTITLAQNNKCVGRKFVATTGSLAGHDRARTGDYRLQFQAERLPAESDWLLTVEKIGHRDGFYDE
jgi:hypothetical protein